MNARRVRTNHRHCPPSPARPLPYSQRTGLPGQSRHCSWWDGCDGLTLCTPYRRVQCLDCRDSLDTVLDETVAMVSPPYRRVQWGISAFQGSRNSLEAATSTCFWLTTLALIPIDIHSGMLKKHLHCPSCKFLSLG